ncbi:MAG: hypothetical protein V1859_09910 [archaeon]
MSDTSVMVPKDEYDMLRAKAELFDHFVETEDLNEEELKSIKKALKGPFMSKFEFLKKHPQLA